MGVGMGWSGWADHCKRICEFTLLHGAAVFVTWFVIYPLQSAVLGTRLTEALFLVPVLLFLPTVIKALAAWMYGWWAVLYILPTALVQHLMLDLPLDATQLSKLVVYLVSAPLVRSCLANMGLDINASRGLHTWRFLIFIVLLSSIMLAAAFLILYAPNLSIREAGLFLALFVLGDIAGSAFVLLILVLVFRFREGRFRAARMRREA